MASVEKLLAEYRSEYSDEAKLVMVNAMIQRATSDQRTLDTLLYVLNEESYTPVRLAIVQFLQAARPLSAIRALTKEMFDPDPIVRAHAALGLADYNDAHLLAQSLPALLDALADPATRAPADQATRVVTGRPPEKITISERMRVKLGEDPKLIWGDHFLPPPPPPDSDESSDPF
jgi:HEAT repeat protein